MSVEAYQGKLLPKERLGDLFDAVARSYRVLGPVARNGSVAIGLVERLEEMAMDYSVTVLPPKEWLHRPVETLFSVTKSLEFEAKEAIASEQPQAIFGLHTCDLTGIRRLDEVFRKHYPDPYYNRRREKTLLVVLNCATPPGPDCFCASMQGGPFAEEGYDVALTDLGDHFLVEAASDAGVAVVSPLQLDDASRESFREKAARKRQSVQKMPKSLNTANLQTILNREMSHPRWGELKEECLGCGNCTMVCPTCYCYSVSDKLDLSLSRAERVRTWDSCQLMEFSAVHGGNFRKDRAARFKQWVYHKLNYWIDQYGAEGCVGCGRCIAWCPAKIDITEVIRDVRGGD